MKKKSLVEQFLIKARLGEPSVYKYQARKRDAHREKFSDIEWAGQQPRGSGHFFIGDVVEFHAGGFGIVREVCAPQSGWPEQYATASVDGLPKNSKVAWHYPLDFKRLVAPSATRSISKNQ